MRIGSEVSQELRAGSRESQHVNAGSGLLAKDCGLVTLLWHRQLIFSIFVMKT